MDTANALASQLDGLVHLDTQRASTGIDLTVDAVFRTTGPGQLDFGGGEFQTVPRERIGPTLDDPDDDYGWWTLEKGAYVVQYNESLRLDDGQQAVVSARCVRERTTVRSYWMRAETRLKPSSW